MNKPKFIGSVSRPNQLEYCKHGRPEYRAYLHRIFRRSTKQVLDAIRDGAPKDDY